RIVPVSGHSRRRGRLSSNSLTSFVERIERTSKLVVGSVCLHGQRYVLIPDSVKGVIVTPPSPCYIVPRGPWRGTMARKPTDMVQLKLRFPEAVRRRLEREAKRNNRSMNTEIIHRLRRTFAIEDSGAATNLLDWRRDRVDDSTKG